MSFKREYLMTAKGLRTRVSYKVNKEILLHCKFDNVAWQHLLFYDCNRSLFIVSMWYFLWPLSKMNTESGVSWIAGKHQGISLYVGQFRKRRITRWAMLMIIYRQIIALPHQRAGYHLVLINGWAGYAPFRKKSNDSMNRCSPIIYFFVVTSAARTCRSGILSDAYFGKADWPLFSLQCRSHHTCDSRGHSVHMSYSCMPQKNI
jgi:hypothetical protein